MSSFEDRNEAVKAGIILLVGSRVRVYRERVSATAKEASKK